VTQHHPHPRGRRRAQLAAAPLGTLVVGLLLAGCGDDAPEATSAGASSSTAGATQPATPSAAATLAPREAPGRQRLSVASAEQVAPVGITIPAIEVDSEVVPVGTEDGVLQVPPQPWVVGWWSDGVGPGSGGGTVVLDAHLDSREYGRGPFTRAQELDVGAGAAIRDAAGDAHDYTVTDVITYEKVELPYEELFAQDGPERVVLVTCGGSYERGSGWDSNVVVVLEPV
jgi:sortase (surface protein transpeptidase)